MFKLRQFSQERFVQELCCDSFAMASTSRPYSSLRTSSRALVWDPGSTESAAQHSCRSSAALVVSLGMRQQLRSPLHVILHYIHGQYCYNMYVQACMVHRCIQGCPTNSLLTIHMLTTLGRGLLGQGKGIVGQLGTLLSCTTLCSPSYHMNFLHLLSCVL